MSSPDQTLTDVELDELQQYLAAAEAALALPPWVPITDVVERFWLCAYAIEQCATRLGSQRLVRVCGDIGVTMSAMRHTRVADNDGARDLMERGLMVLGVMVGDIERQRDGYAPAALDEAIDALLDHLRREHQRRAWAA